MIHNLAGTLGLLKEFLAKYVLCMKRPIVSGILKSDVSGKIKGFGKFYKAWAPNSVLAAIDSNLSDKL